MLLQVAVRDIGQLTDFALRAVGRCVQLLLAHSSLVGSADDSQRVGRVLVHGHEPNLHEYENVVHGKAR